MTKKQWMVAGILTAGSLGATEVYVGSGSDGIYRLELNEETGALSEAKRLVKGNGMSFQEIDADGEVIYSTLRTAGQGAVSSYRITEDGLEETSVQFYTGGGLCHVSLDAEEKVLFGADYGGGLVVSFPVSEGVIGELVSLHKHEGSSVNKKRQSAPHAHSVYAGPDNRFAYAPDLGIDLVKFYEIGPQAALKDRGGFAVPPGSGPRHMKFGRKGKFAYVLNELTLTVSVFARDEDSGELTRKQTTSVLPPQGDPSEMSCSEIRVSADGRFLYTANRDLRNEKRDSVSVLAIAKDGTVTHLATSPAEVWIPRNINLSPSGDWLLVAGQNSNEVTSHRIDDKTGKLTFSGHRSAVPKAMCINFRAEK